MSRKLLAVSVTTALLGSTALAEAPSVSADIPPVHSLVARVMDGVGTPNLIVQTGASPHGYMLRPSEAAALQEADLVFLDGRGADAVDGERLGDSVRRCCGYDAS